MGDLRPEECINGPINMGVTRTDGQSNGRVNQSRTCSHQWWAS